MPGCGHVVTIQCHIDVARPEYRCQRSCNEVLHCAHTCKGPCWKCTVRTEDGVNMDHSRCLQVCGRNQSTCVHSCGKTCHGTEPCPPPLAICNVMFNVRIRSAPGVARSLAPHVQSRRVCHPVRIASVPCPALLHATIYLARDVVRNFLDAVINAHQFVERYVLHGS